MDRFGSADRDVVGHYSRLLWPRRFGVRLVAAVMRIALVEKRGTMTEPSFLDAFTPPQKR
jgi:hypothetical protein